MADDFFFSYVSFEDVGKSCIMQQTKKAISTLENDNSDDLHTLKLFIKSYFEAISSGVNDLVHKVQELDRRMRKLELFSETTADELLKYYIEVFRDIDRNPDEIREVFINGLGRNNVIILMKKIQEYVSLQSPQDKKLLDKISCMIEILDSSEASKKGKGRVSP